MYQKNYVLLLISVIIASITLGWTRNYLSPGTVLAAPIPVIETQSADKPLVKTSSKQRQITCMVLTPQYVVEADAQDIDALMRLVEAEAGCEDETGKLLVANVVLNRVRDSHFPDSIYEVIYQKNERVTQFSPVSNGSIDTVKVSDETREVVYRALYGEDVSQGALYFMARRAAEADSVYWFDNNLTLLFSYGGHDFFA